jgi:hypothetical protein
MSMKSHAKIMSKGGPKRKRKVFRHSLKVDFHESSMTPTVVWVIYFYWFFRHNPKQKKKCFLSCHLGVAYSIHLAIPILSPFDSVSSVSFCFRLSFSALKGECFLLLTRMCQGESERILWKIAIEVLRLLLNEISASSVENSPTPRWDALKSDKHKNMLLRRRKVKSGGNYYTH